MKGETSQVPIIGYEAIARAVSARLKTSCCVRTVKRYARQGRTHRLPVMIYPNRRAYLLPADLEVWAAAWLVPRPSGAREPGRVMPALMCPQPSLATPAAAA